MAKTFLVPSCGQLEQALPVAVSQTLAMSSKLKAVQEGSAWQVLEHSDIWLKIGCK